MPESERVRDQRLHDSIIEENLRRGWLATDYSDDGLGADWVTVRNFKRSPIAEDLLPFEVDETEEEFLARLDVIVALDRSGGKASEAALRTGLRRLDCQDWK